MKKVEKEIIEAKFEAKNQIMLKTNVLRDFNGYCMIIGAESIIVIQKNQAKKLMLIDVKDNTKKQ